MQTGVKAPVIMNVNTIEAEKTFLIMQNIPRPLYLYLKDEESLTIKKPLSYVR